MHCKRHTTCVFCENATFVWHNACTLIFRTVSKNAIEGKSLKIDDIERMLGEVKVEMDEIITEATGEVITESAPPTEKKNVPVAERICADSNEK